MVANRRRFSRIDVDLDAVLRRNDRQYATRVRNFCSGGMLMECSGAAELKGGMWLQVEIQMDSGQGGAGLCLDLEVRHSDPPFIGAAFVQPPFGALQRLHRRAQQAMPTPKVTTAVADVSLDQFRQRFFARLEEAVVEALQETDRTLTKEAEAHSIATPKDDTLARLHFSLTKGGAGLARATRQQLEQSLDRFMASQRRSEGADPARAVDRLALVERSQFESWLVANIAARSVEARMEVTLNKLAGLFQQVLGRPVAVEVNPVAPGAVVHQLHSELRTLDFNDDELTLLYRFLGAPLAVALKEVYGAALWDVPASTPVAQPLVRATPPVAPRTHADGTPDRRDTAARSGKDTFRSSSGTSTAAQPPAVAASTPGFGVRRVHGADMVETLRSLLSLRNDVLNEERAVGDGDSGTGEPEYSADELQQVVGTLAQAALRERRPVVSLKQEILRSLRGFEGKDGRPLPGPEAELIEVTERLFQAMESNPVVHPILKKHAPRLKFVVLRSVLRDPAFFSSEQHTLRQLINQLGRLGAGRMAQEQLEALLEQIVKQVVEDPDPCGLQARLLSQVTSQIQRQEFALERAVERIAKEADAQRRVQAARRQVSADIRKRLVGRQIPELVLQLLYDLGWRQHLLVCRLKQERAYRKALAIIDVLLQRAELPKDGTKPAGALSADNLRALVQTELPQLSAFQGASSRATAWHAAFDEWLEGNAAAAVVLVELDRFKALEAGHGPTESSPGAPGEGAVRGAVADLRPGDWVRVQRSGAPDRFLKLAWSDGATLRFAYFDDQGLQTTSHGAVELSQWFERGQARRLDERDWAMVEQGLYRVVHSVYEDVLTKVSRDPLTGLINRHEFEMQLERYIARCRTDGSRHVLCYIDIDRFKVVNNTLGVQAGDAVLKGVAAFLLEQSAANVAIARLGGNEFGALLPDCSKRLGMDLAEQLREAVERKTFEHDGQPIKITLSIGVTTLTDQVDNLSELLKRANLAGLAAKEQGGNRVRAYQPSSRDQARQQELMSWLPRLERPLEELATLRCQPIVPLRAEGETALAHYEVLLAVRGAGDTLLSPVPLIEAAEKFNRMTRVDRWVIEQIFRWLKENPQKAANIDGFSINLSGNSLNDELFLRNLLGLLRAYPELSRKICFEVTETAAVTSLAKAADFVRQVKQCGCRLSLDDFGTGLSSYAYLQQLPVDYVKIDGIFVRNLVDNPKDQALVKSIAELARFMGIQTIAEYVENQQVLDVLKRLGVDQVQGYHLGKPILLEQL